MDLLDEAQQVALAVRKPTEVTKNKGGRGVSEERQQHP